MAQPLTVALPPNLELWDGCILRFKAVDPTTGSNVTGVKISDIGIEVESTDADKLAYGPFILVTGPGG